MSEITHLDLCGNWELRQIKGELKIPAKVPGCVHLDLLREGLIEDPYVNENEKALGWIGEADWEYSRVFDLPPHWNPRSSQIHLRANGLDTLAEIIVNGHKVASTENMFRQWSFPVGDFLYEGRNHLRVVFSSPLRAIRERQSKNPLRQAGVIDERISGSSWLRKEQCNFGWDWGPKLVTAGIWRRIYLTCASSFRNHIQEARLSVSWDQAGFLTVTPQIKGHIPFNAGEQVETTILDGASNVVQHWGTSAIEPESRKINNPKLWWPNGMGQAHCYTVQFSLKTQEGTLLDQIEKKQGFRRIELIQEPDRWGHSFYFRINGIPFFAKGANWIPPDCFDSRVSDNNLRNLLESAADVGMNMIRVWGGGIYERDSFYDFCDELGLCVWQDFMYACAAYPVNRSDFLSNALSEATQVVTRLRNHPCIALWCGNNEIEQMRELIGDGKGAMRWEDYSQFFDVELREIVSKLDPSVPYWPSSPHTPHEKRECAWDESAGDAHPWDVWHGRKPFEWYRTSFPRFVSEFGFQSFPEPATVAKFAPRSEWNVTSPVIEFHQRSGIGNQTILAYMLEWFRLPAGFENIVWVSQILQALAVTSGVEHWRLQGARCMGALYWQLNDTWPCPSWSSIDYYGRWKALHYTIKRVFATTLIAAFPNERTGEATVFLTTESRSRVRGHWSWMWESLDGDNLSTGRNSITLAAGETRFLGKIDPPENFDPRKHILWVEFRSNQGERSNTTVLFARPKALELRDPELECILESTDAGWRITVSAHRPALWVWFSCESTHLRFSENFFHLPKGEQRVIEAVPAPGEGRPELLPPIEARTLFDTVKT